jgi:hypothetical protein
MKEAIGSAALKMAYRYLDSDPEKNAPKLMHLVEKLDADGSMQGQLSAVRKALEDKDGNWYRLIMSMWEDIDAGVRGRSVLQLRHSTPPQWVWAQRSRRCSRKYDCQRALGDFVGPDLRLCNLHCGAAGRTEYGKSTA